MKDRICPIMSKPIPALGAYDQQTSEVYWVDCQKENCALWIGLYCKEGDKLRPREYGCAFAMLAMKNPQTGYITY